MVESNSKAQAAKAQIFHEDLETGFRVNILEVRTCISLRSTMCPRDGKHHSEKIHFSVFALCDHGID